MSNLMYCDRCARAQTGSLDDWRRIEIRGMPGGAFLYAQSELCPDCAKQVQAKASKPPPFAPDPNLMSCRHCGHSWYDHPRWWGPYCLRLISRARRKE